MDELTDKAILFDADSAIYGAGFVTEKVVYTYDGQLMEGEDDPVSSLPRALKFCKKYDLPPMCEAGVSRIDLEVSPQPLANAIHILNQVYDGIEEALMSYGKVYTLLSESPTFRHELATMKPYKISRINDRKPYHYDALRKYMFTVRDAISIEGLEADDLCGIFQKEGTVIVGIDKDLLTIPGDHYNWKTKKLREVTQLEADRYFYEQLLSGDKGDDIPGLSFCAEETMDIYSLHHSARRGCGVGSATKILETAETAEEMYARVREAYFCAHKQSHTHMGFEYDARAEMGTLCDLRENGRLLHMTRELNEDCTPVYWELPDEDDRRALEIVR
jgi:hypothetical protein